MVPMALVSEVITAALAVEFSWLKCGDGAVGAGQKVPGDGGGRFMSNFAPQTEPVASCLRDGVAGPEALPHQATGHHKHQSQLSCISMAATSSVSRHGVSTTHATSGRKVEVVPRRYTNQYPTCLVG